VSLASGIKGKNEVNQTPIPFYSIYLLPYEMKERKKTKEEKSNSTVK